MATVLSVCISVCLLIMRRWVFMCASACWRCSKVKVPVRWSSVCPAVFLSVPQSSPARYEIQSLTTTAYSKGKKGKGTPTRVERMGPGLIPNSRQWACRWQYAWSWTRWWAATTSHQAHSDTHMHVITFRQAHSYLPSRRASPFSGQHQLILLRDRGT